MRLSLLASVSASMMIVLASAAALAASGPSAVAHLKTSSGQDAGTATLHQGGDGRLTIKLDLKNLPFGEHAVLIHRSGICEPPDFKTSGGHFNPDHKQHGTLNPLGHHNGDLPANISIGEDHTGSATFKVTDLSLTDGAADNLLADGGTSIVVHERADDRISDPAGNAGNRIACGVIAARR